MVTKNFIKKGGLVKYIDHYINGNSYVIYGEIVFILDKEKKKRNSLNLIRGYGDLNTKATIYMKPICDVNLNPITELFIKPNSDGLVALDEHSIYIINIKETVAHIEKEIVFLNNKIDFFKKYSIYYKLEELLKDV
jgi:hypothetical protein